MREALFDTTVFIDWWKGEAPAMRLVQQVMSRSITASYSPISYLELFQFPELSRREELAYRVLARCLEEAPVTLAIATAAGSHLQGLPRNQRARLMADALIASTALVRGEPILSRNPDDMRRFYPNVQTY